MVITKPIPYNAWMGGRKVRVMYRQQTKRCGQCGLTAPEGCEYRANTEDCYNAGGARADLEQVWNIILARAKGEICPEDSVLRKENADRAEKRRVAEESSAAGELAGEDPVDPDLMPKPVDPAFYLSYPPIEVAEPRDPNPLRRPRRNSVRPGGRSRTNTVTETADEEEPGNVGTVQTKSTPPKTSEEKAKESDVVELFGIPFNKVKIWTSDLENWLRGNNFVEYRTNDEGYETMAWKIMNVPARKKCWLIAGLTEEERIKVYDLEDKKIKDYIFKARPYTIEAASKDGVTAASFEEFQDSERAEFVRWSAEKSEETGQQQQEMETEAPSDDDSQKPADDQQKPTFKSPLPPREKKKKNKSQTSSSSDSENDAGAGAGAKLAAEAEVGAAGTLEKDKSSSPGLRSHEEIMAAMSASNKAAAKAFDDAGKNLYKSGLLDFPDSAEDRNKEEDDAGVNVSAEPSKAGRVDWSTLADEDDQETSGGDEKVDRDAAGEETEDHHNVSPPDPSVLTSTAKESIPKCQASKRKPVFDLSQNEQKRPRSHSVSLPMGPGTSSSDLVPSLSLASSTLNSDENVFAMETAGLNRTSQNLRYGTEFNRSGSSVEASSSTLSSTTDDLPRRVMDDQGYMVWVYPDGSRSSSPPHILRAMEGWTDRDEYERLHRAQPGTASWDEMMAMRDAMGINDRGEHVSNPGIAGAAQAAARLLLLPMHQRMLRENPTFVVAEDGSVNLPQHPLAPSVPTSPTSSPPPPPPSPTGVAPPGAAPTGDAVAATYMEVPDEDGLAFINPAGESLSSQGKDQPVIENVDDMDSGGENDDNVETPNKSFIDPPKPVSGIPVGIPVNMLNHKKTGTSTRGRIGSRDSMRAGSRSSARQASAARSGTPGTPSRSHRNCSPGGTLTPGGTSRRGRSREIKRPAYTAKSKEGDGIVSLLTKKNEKD